MEIKKDVSISTLTSWKTSGTVAQLWLGEDEADLLKFAQEEKKGKKFFILGKGSNLLIMPGQTDKIFFKLGPSFANYDFSGQKLRAGAAASLMGLALKARESSLSGLEFASGIPGSLGGAIIMNAGAHGREMKDILQEVRVFDKEREDFLTLSPEEMDFDYRKSFLKNQSRYIVIDALIKLKSADKDEIKNLMENYKEGRLKSQPWDYPSAGSVFKNPPGFSAGQLIDQAGLKGLAINKAQISEKHGNFIINLGGADSQDILLLIENVEKLIKEKYNIHLEREVIVID